MFHFIFAKFPPSILVCKFNSIPLCTQLNQPETDHLIHNISIETFRGRDGGNGGSGRGGGGGIGGSDCGVGGW